jgi:uncharacterized sulfatase
MRLTNIKTDPDIKLDGQDISAVIKGKSAVHSPIFSMKGTTIRTIRDGNWKLFVAKPEYYKEIDLTNWKDPRGPDGTTIIAPFVQATPADYPGVKPEKMEGEMLLFDVVKDPGETKDLSKQYPQVKEDLIRKYNEFLATFH